MSWSRELRWVPGGGSPYAPPPEVRTSHPTKAGRRWSITARACLLAALLAAPALGADPRAADAQAPREADWHLDRIRVPHGLHGAAPSRPVVVAIVDDAVRTTHRDLAPFLWRRPGEIPANGIDDDGNGAIDDARGWDVSDGDNDVNPPLGDASTHDHGTHLAGLVTGMARRAFGAQAPQFVRLLPVKVLSDWAADTYLRDGYAGVRYALDAGADIVLCAWGEPELKPEMRALLREARRRGILVVASVGNEPDEVERFPAAVPGVVAVAGSDADDARMTDSNYGAFVDLTAPGLGLTSSDAAGDGAARVDTGTSQATALVAGAAALLKARHPELTPDRLLAYLKNTAVPLDAGQPGHVRGKLGAGRIDVAAALARAAGRDTATAIASDRHQGYLVRDATVPGRRQWDLQPVGEVEGFWFAPRTAAAAPGSRLRFYADGAEEPVAEHVLEDLPARIRVPGARVRVVLEAASGGAAAGGTEPVLLIEYGTQTIRYATRYCDDEPVTVADAGTFEDGSRSATYAPLCSCMWQITAPEGKRIRIEFERFDTEARTDWVLLFDGESTRQQSMMARFSGPDIPPVLTTWSHRALLWFVSDDRNQGEGWKARVSFVDPEPRQPTP